MTIPSLAKIRESVSHTIIEHHRFEEIQSIVDEYIRDSFKELPANIVALVGPSRVGKSEVVSSVAKKYPPRIDKGLKEISVLVVKTPSPVNPLTLPHCVLTALGFNAKRGAENADTMVKQLRLAKTKTIIFEEASHVVEVNARVIPRAAGDFFKGLAENLGITVIFVGIPHLTMLLESNEQLGLRAHAPVVFLPYATHDEDYKKFGRSVVSSLETFKDAGVTFSIGDGQIVENLYLCSGGLFGIVHKFFLELARVVESSKLKTVTEDDCFKVVQKIGSAGHPKAIAFAGKPVSLSAMVLSHTTVLARYGLTPAAPPPTPTTTPTSTVVI